MNTAELSYPVFHGENVHVRLCPMLAELLHWFVLKYFGVNKEKALNVVLFEFPLKEMMFFSGLG